MTGWKKQARRPVPCGEDTVRGWDERRSNRAKATSKLLKSAWGMPRLLEARKDVTSCEKPRGGANSH